MSEYAPTPIKQLASNWENAIPSALLSGIIGDSQHTYGYHRGANYISSGDYSRQLYADRVGVDGEAAAALDISMNSSDMILVTSRLRASANDPNDNRLNGIREFAGTLDGRTTFNKDCQDGSEGYGVWDDSHIWHAHISFLRSNVNNTTVMTNVLSVVTQKASIIEPPSEDEDMIFLCQVAGKPAVFASDNAQTIRWLTQVAVDNYKAQAKVGTLKVWANGATIVQEANRDNLQAKWGILVGKTPSDTDW